MEDSDRKSIDESKHPCYQETVQGISVIIAEAPGGVNKERLSMALDVILSESGVKEYLRSIRARRNKTDGI